MIHHDRRGFTLAELIVVAVVGGFLIAATFEVLITNQRTYTAQNAQIQGTQALRGAADVLSAELREISPAGGDLVSMGSDSIHIRAGRHFGVACAVVTTPAPKLTVFKVGDWFADDDSVFVFADNDGTTADDDVWITTKVTARDTTASCGPAKAQDLTLGGATAAFAADSVSQGAEVRSFTHYTYGLVQYEGEYFLGRRGANGTTVPLVGPLSSNGITFDYLDSDGNSTTVSTDVAQVEITLRTSSDVLDSRGKPVADSLTIRVQTRN